MSAVSRAIAVGVRSNSFLKKSLDSVLSMDSQTTLGLESLEINKQTGKCVASRHSSKRAKGRQGAVTPHMFDGVRLDKQDDMRQSRNVPSSPSSLNALRLASANSIPSYTALNVPPPGISAWSVSPPSSTRQPSVQVNDRETPRSVPTPSRKAQKAQKARESPSPSLVTSRSSTAMSQARSQGLSPIATPSVLHLPGILGPRMDKLDGLNQAASPSTIPLGASLPTQFGRQTSSVRPAAIPEPTSDYLKRASVPPIRLDSPQHLLIVLDLNGTLLIRRPGSKSYHPRPCLQPFLDYCLANHFLLIWSSAMPANVQGVCSKLFTPSQRSLLLGEWGRDTFGLTSKKYRERVQVYKRLSWVWAEKGIQALHPWAEHGVKWDQGNTVLIDDSSEKGRSEPWNLVQVPGFVKEKKKVEEGDVLAQVVGWMEEARGWSDISGFIWAMGKSFKGDHSWMWDWAGAEGGEVNEEVDEDEGGVRLPTGF